MVSHTDTQEEEKESPPAGVSKLSLTTTTNFKMPARGRPRLKEQKLDELDVTKLHPLSLQLISRQATINIVVIGNGKSSVVEAISRVKTSRIRSEPKRTKLLGFANAKIFKCENRSCPRPKCFGSHGGGKEDNPLCDACRKSRMKLLGHVCFVSCPDHDTFMATILLNGGAAIIDGVLLLMAATESCHQRRTHELLSALQTTGHNNIIVFQHMTDIVKKYEAIIHHQQLHKFIHNTLPNINAPIVPVSKNLKNNTDVACEYIAKEIPIPARDFLSPPNMVVIRLNKKLGSEENDVVVGGSIRKGVLKVNQSIEIRPGIVEQDKDGKISCKPLYTRIVSLHAEQNELQFAVPGGLIGVGTTLDPCLTRGDQLVGQIVGEVGSLPDVFIGLEVKFVPLTRCLWFKRERVARTKLEVKDVVMVNVCSKSISAVVRGVKNDDLVKLQLAFPVCTNKGEKVALSWKFGKDWRLIGYGTIRAGVALDVPPARS